MSQVTKQTTPRPEDVAWRRFPELPIITVTVCDTPGGLEPSITYDMRECKQQTSFQGPYFWDDFDKQMLQEYEEAYAEQQHANDAQPPLASVAQPLLEKKAEQLPMTPDEGLSIPDFTDMPYLCITDDEDAFSIASLSDTDWADLPCSMGHEPFHPIFFPTSDISTSSIPARSAARIDAYVADRHGLYPSLEEHADRSSPAASVDYEQEIAELDLLENRSELLSSPALYDLEGSPLSQMMAELHAALQASNADSYDSDPYSSSFLTALDPECVSLWQLPEAQYEQTAPKVSYAYDRMHSSQEVTNWQFSPSYSSHMTYAKAPLK